MDPAAEGQWLLIVTAQDMGTPPLSSAVPVLINVQVREKNQILHFDEIRYESMNISTHILSYFVQ